MDGEHLGNNRVKLGFGKSMPYSCVWVDGVGEGVTEKYLRIQFEPYGAISKIHVDRDRGQALVFYEQVLSAQAAVNKMRGHLLKNGGRVQVDFASRECQEAFFERLEKQGGGVVIVDGRTSVSVGSVFDEGVVVTGGRTSRSFEATVAVTRYSRYESSSSRPRTSSYGGTRSAPASSSAGHQSPSAVSVVGVVGSATPRTSERPSRGGTGRRCFDYYSAAAVADDYAPLDRHLFRSYDEYSQASSASHDDLYDHEYGFVHDSPTHLDGVMTFAPPEIRNLQKERVHLLEQLEECPSSGDELISPKKRLKLDLLESAMTSDVIIEANRDHRKVTEVRRLSDTPSALSKLSSHHSRRPSADSSSSSSKHSRHDGDRYVTCKRRKTQTPSAGSSNHHHHSYVSSTTSTTVVDHHNAATSGSEAGGSRPGTPLCDERPENCSSTMQVEPPRRTTREREGPISLPLPKFAAQVISRGAWISSIAAATKQQQQTVTCISTNPQPHHQHPHSTTVPAPLSSPPGRSSSNPAPRPPSPAHMHVVPPPASPPPRRPSSGTSSDSDGAASPPSPSLEERIRSLDEKYERWSGSRVATGNNGSATGGIEACLERFRQRHKLLDLDLKEIQPSEIVKSVLAKRSVFDEDLKRLENVNEKYEPRDFGLFSSRLTGGGSAGTIISTSTISSTTDSTPTPSVALKLSTLVGALPAGQPTTVTVATAATVLATGQQTPPHGVMSPRATPGSNLPAPAAKGLQYPFPTHPPLLIAPAPPPMPPQPISTTPISTATPTIATIPSSVVTTPTTLSIAPTTVAGDSRLKPCSATATPKPAPVNRSASTEKPSANIPPTSAEVNRAVRETKSSDKVTSRRDSGSSSSPRGAAEITRRRNSDSNRRAEPTESSSERERAQSEERKKERLEKIRIENEKLEKERLDRESAEKEKQEKERAEKERLEKERLERENELEKQRLEKERLEKERLDKERIEQERLEKERIEKQRQETERLEKEQIEKERLEKERIERERTEKERKERKDSEEKERREREEQARQDKEERERREKEELERREKEDRERRERQEEEAKATAKERHEKERRHKEDNQDNKKKDDHSKHSDSSSRHKENSLDKHTKDSTTLHSHSGDKVKHHFEKERSKESIKENRDNNVHEKQRSEVNNRGVIESRHMSIELDKNRLHYEIKDNSKRKERNNSLPASLGSKRRLSAHESLENIEECKKLKLSHEHKKVSERRDSKDSTRSEDKSKSKHKNNVNKSHEKSKDEEKRKEKDKEREERHKKHKQDKQKSKSKSREKDTTVTISSTRESPNTTTSPITDKDFMAHLDLRSNEDIEKLKREVKEKQHTEEKEIKDDKLKKSCEKHNPDKPKSRSPEEPTPEERKKKERLKSGSESDEPRKHSIFDIVVDEPAYISMYDKVKARSCKNMAKQEEEKRQEKIKAKFSQLKQSRAKREEKKRSTSWDEDSDSEKDHTEVKMKRCPKMLIDSSDDESQDRRHTKKREIYTDSDSSVAMRHIKQEPIDTSDDEIKEKNKHLALKNIKSRISGDTSEDDCNRKKVQIKTELLSDTENTTTEVADEKAQLVKIKDEMERLIKKERRNSKHQEAVKINETNATTVVSFADKNLPEEKPEQFSYRHSFVDNTSDEEMHEAVKKEKAERREKKHKKRQKKQKHLLSEDETKIDVAEGNQTDEKTKLHERKKEHSKKEKRRDKTREGKEKSKKSKKNKDQKSDGKREAKMENIFGSLSEDSENGTKEPEQEEQKQLENFMDEETAPRPTICISEAEKEREPKTQEKEEREREREEHKRRKEKKRREKERRLKEAQAAAEAISNENSMDFADMGKQLEANMMQDESLDSAENKTPEGIPDISRDNSFNFTGLNDVSEHRDKEERKEGKEKKKKRKKSKDERGKHHHHHHHDKNKTKPPEVKKEASSPTTEVPLVEVVPAEPKNTPQHPSLPTLDEPSPVENESPASDFLCVSPIPREPPLISPIPSTPTTSKEKKRDKLIPGFGTDIDEKLHESAVKSISKEFEPVVKKEEIKEEEPQVESQKIAEEKPRVIISQEETEDAVAALLGESFGDEQYNEEIPTPTDQPIPLVEESIVQDDEEMRQAVQSLSATDGDLDVKPDTPQSEHELQIDTDTEEQDEVAKYEPKTPEISQPTTLEFYPARTEPEKVPTIQNPIVIKTTASIVAAPSSPPSLTPIKSAVEAKKIIELEARKSIGLEARKSIELEARKSIELESKSLPVLPEHKQVPVVTQSWSMEKKIEMNDPTLLKIENRPSIEPTKAPPLRQYPGPTLLKLSEPTVYKTITKPELPTLTPVVDPPKIIQTNVSKSPTSSQMHNLPARSPVQSSKPSMSLHDPNVPSKITTGLVHNRLPITPVMASKPMQATTVILQQSKLPHTLDPPKLVPTSERPRMVFQASAQQFANFAPGQPRMMIQGNIRHLPPQGLLVPTRQINPQTFSYLSQPNFNMPPVIKDGSSAVTPQDKPQMEMKVPPLSIVTTQPSTHVPLHLPPMVPKEHTSKPPTPTLSSPRLTTSTPSPKSYKAASPSPRPVNVPNSPIMPAVSPKPASLTPCQSPKISATAVPTPVSTAESSQSDKSELISSTAEIASSNLEIVNSKPEIIQSKVELPPSSPLKPESAPVEPVTTPEQPKIVEVQIPETVTKAPTSVPSSVIMSPKAPKDEEPKAEAPKEEVTELPKKLAIEKVTDELNVSLRAEIPEVKEEPMEVKPEEKPKIELKVEPNIEPKIEPKEEQPAMVPAKEEPIKDCHSDKENAPIEKMDEEKTETESIVSDVSKERLSADILTKDDPLDTKEDSDYWSAKEVNIDSVIKTLCSADELSDHSEGETAKDEWLNNSKVEEPTKPEITDKKESEVTPEKKEVTLETKDDEAHNIDESAEPEDSTQKETNEVTTPRSSNPRGRGGRGRRGGKTPTTRAATVERGGIQTRRGKLKEQVVATTPVKRGRGGRPRGGDRKTSKTESENASTDVYEFRDESDEANKEQRPRLILTIKSPAVSSSSGSQTTAIVKEVTKDGAKEIVKEVPSTTPPKEQVTPIKTESKEDFTPPTPTNTRKSRRLQEKDTSRNAIDDTIDDVVKNTTVQTRSTSHQRRATRQQGAASKQVTVAPLPETPRKSPRGRKARRGSEATETSSSEETTKEEVKRTIPTPPPPSPAPTAKDSEPTKESPATTESEIPKPPEMPPKEKPLESLKAAMLRRIKGEMAAKNQQLQQHEPTNLIDPVTGELIPMRECEEGKYIPLPGSVPPQEEKKPLVEPPKPPSSPISAVPDVITTSSTLTAITSPVVTTSMAPAITSTIVTTTYEALKPSTSVISQPQQIAIVQQVKPPTLKAHVLSSQACQAAVIQPQVSVQVKVAPIPVSVPIVSSVPQPPVVTVAAKHVPMTTPSKPVITTVVSRPIPSPVVAKAAVPSMSITRTSSPIVISKITTPIITTKPTTPMVTRTLTPINQHLTVNTSMSMGMISPSNLSPRPNVSMSVASKPMPKQVVKPPVLSPVLGLHKPAQPIIQQGKQQPMVTQAMVNTQLAHMKQQPQQQPILKQQQVIMGKAPIVKSVHSLHQGQILTGAVPSPQSPLGAACRIIPPPMGAAKGMMEPPKVDVSMANIILGQRAKLSPQAPQQRLAGMPLPGYEPSLGEPVAHFSPGPLRPPPDLTPAHYIHPTHVMQYQQYLRQQLQLTRTGIEKLGDGQEGEEAPVTSPPLELRRPGSVGLALTSRAAAVPHSLHSPHDRATDSPQIAQVYNAPALLPGAAVAARGVPPPTPTVAPFTRYYDGGEPPPAHRPLTSHAAGLAGLGPPPHPQLSIERPLPSHHLGAAGNLLGAVARHAPSTADAPATQRGLQAATPPHASQVPPQAESLFMLLKHYPCMWQGLLALKNDQAAVQMYFVSGNDDVAKCSLPKNMDGSTPPLRIFQRMRLEPLQVEGVARKMQMENEHCMLLALPCGHDHMDVLKQSRNLTSGFITYLQQKQAAGIVNVAAPGTTQPPAYVIHIFPTCDFVNENLRRIAPSLLERVADIAHLLIVITTV
ncbi:unnamed protein product [Acanthoscelides obtectus]|uniref:Protein split ends n=1 Tax=Acanthoscelides obtectus TaxID=200917 RepID=A0A9P0NXW3_ACAOB|nr:unnamed protein product [Acanthoscelides obtectus]CAK1679013.1 Protein split ends [Acanthoscelides obtectus]